MRPFALLLVFPLAAQAQIAVYDYLSGPITSVQSIGAGSRLTGPPLGEDIYGIITLNDPLPVNGTVTVTPNTVAFGVTGGFGIVFESPALPVGPMTFTTMNGAITGFDVALSTPPSSPDGYSFAAATNTDTRLVSAGGGFALIAGSGGWYQPPPLPPGYYCTHDTATACEAIGPRATDHSFQYNFFEAPPTSVPEIDPAGLLPALTLLAGLLAMLRAGRMRRPPHRFERRCK